MADFEQRAVADAAVQQCYRPSPGSDVVRVVRAADIPAYQALVQRAKLEPAIGLPAPPAR